MPEVIERPNPEAPRELRKLAHEKGRDPLELLKEAVAGTPTLQDAASQLRVSRQTLRRWLDHYDLEVR